MEKWVDLEELGRAWNGLMALQRASIVEAEPEGLNHLEAKVSSSEPRGQGMQWEPRVPLCKPHLC